MEVIEELTISTSSVPPKVWKRYVDDIFVIVKNDAVTSSHNTLYASDPKISFTIELENSGQIFFLDTLVSRGNGVAVIYVYRKPTHTDRYLDFFSHHDIKHKINTASTLSPSCDKELLYRVLKLQKRAARIILYADRLVPSVTLFNKLGWIPFMNSVKLTNVLFFISA